MTAPSPSAEVVQLLPCPFCSELPHFDRGCDAMACHCGATGPLPRSAIDGCLPCLKDEAVFQWNTRALPASRDEGWREIETAPKDGTKVLLWVGNMSTTGMRYEVTTGWYSMHPPMWIHGSSQGPTHWRQLPTPPASEGERDAG